MFSKIEHTKVKDAVVRQFEALILEGVLRPGDQVPVERELAKMLDVSRPTLRDALGELEQRQLLVARHGGGTFVADLFGSVFAQPIVSLFGTHTKALADYLEFRGRVEPVAAELAAVRATDADREILSRIYGQMKEAHGLNDPDEEARLDVQLHSAIADASHNIVLIQTLRSIYALLVHGVFYNRTVLYGRPGTRDVLLDQHGAIYRAVMAGDADAARTSAHAHIVYVEEMMKDLEEHLTREQTSRRRLEHLIRQEDQQRKRSRRTA
jgi:GntR family transcriptional repressor for pyruvate dehydrogenase complex